MMHVTLDVLLRADFSSVDRSGVMQIMRVEMEVCSRSFGPLLCLTMHLSSHIRCSSIPVAEKYPHVYDRIGERRASRAQFAGQTVSRDAIVEEYFCSLPFVSPLSTSLHTLHSSSSSC